MAVVQISKIQLRRGKKNSGTGMPQLASGELAWAIDTQELFVGNGAVSEGSPYVGNTKILTEHDNILELLTSYQYKYDSSIGQSLIGGTTLRSLQSRLDDGIVNVRSFGIKSVAELSSGESSDQTSKIQTAINELVTGSPVTLEFNPGEYEIASEITLPSNVKISGTGKDTTVFLFTGVSGNVFSTIVDSERIFLKDFTVKYTTNSTTALRINNSKNCEFVNLKFLFDDGNAVASGTTANNRIGIRITGNGTISSNKFSKLEFKRLTYGIYADSNASFNTIDDCLFEYLYQGVNLGLTSSGGANYNTISDCVFDNVTRQAIVVENGTGNRSRGNNFKNVGSTNSGTFSNYSVIKFVTDGNASSNDMFERKEYLEFNNPLFNSNPYIPEIDGIVANSLSEPRQISLPETTTSPQMIFKLPLTSAIGYKVDYIFRSTTYGQVRKGTMHLVVDRVNSRVQLVDEYEFVGASAAGEDAIVFTASIITVTGGVKVVTINYTNSNVDDISTLTYNYSVIS